MKDTTMLPDPKIVLTGIKPTGRPHLGNYVGMIRPTLEIVRRSGHNSNFLFIANYHALNSLTDAAQLKEYTYDVAASLLALGLETQNVHFYRQTDVPQICELSILLASVTPKGLMNRAHAYKAAVDNNKKTQNRDQDDGINMGLFTYPILMAADILLFNANVIPVGKDQVQHVEFARDIAGYFNRKYDIEAFNLPKALVQESQDAIVGLDGRKMSKSYGNTIPIFGERLQLKTLVMKIVTDSRLPHEPKSPETSNVFLLYSAVATQLEAETMRSKFENGQISYGDAKKELLNKLYDNFEIASQRYNEYLSDKAELERMLQSTAEGVKEIAETRMQFLRSIVGI